MVGTKLAHYFIQEKIGEGGMGIVYKAKDTRLRRTVAIKILLQHLTQHRKALKRFIREAQTASALNHPNICIIYDIGHTDGIYYIVMEFIEGGTLREILNRNGALPEQEVIEIGLKICDGLDAAHTKGIIHRDIKPENIMISQEGHVKITDFGLAKLKNTEIEVLSEIKSNTSNTDNRSSLSGLMGTASYMSPEQIEKEKLDERTDIFSLGIVLYEMLTGAPPFKGDDNLAVMTSILEYDPKPPSVFEHLTRPEMDGIVLKALSKVPAVRQNSISELLRDLKKLKETEDKKRVKRKTITYAIIWSIPLILIIALSIFMIGFFKKKTSLPPPSLKIYPVILSSVYKNWPSFLPDGNSILYVSGEVDTKEPYDICIKDLISGRTKIISEKRGFTADMSPDGTKIVYTAASKDIFIADTSGKDLAKIADKGFMPRWSPDGRQIAFCTTLHTDLASENGIYLYNLEHKILREVSPRNELKFAYPDWSPDNRWIVCMGGEGSLWKLWLIEVATGKSRQISDFEIGYPIWTASGEFIYFLSAENGPSDVWRVPVDIHSGKLTGPRVQVTTGLDISSMDVSPKSDKLIFILNDFKAQIWRIPVSGMISDPLGEAKLIMSNLGSTEDVEITSDGTKLLIDSKVKGVRSLILKSLADGSESVIYCDLPPFAPSWSPDGRWIAFDAGGGNNADIYRIPAIGGTAEKIIANPGADWLPTYSPDGKRICYVSNQSGQFDLWVQNMENGERMQLTNSVDRESRGCWSHDGRRLAYFRKYSGKDSSGIWIYDFSTREAQELLRFQESTMDILNKVVWKEDDSAVYFFSPFGSHKHKMLIEVSLISKEKITVFEDTRAEFMLRRGAFTVFKDFGYFASEEGTTDIWLAEGLQ